MKLLLYLLLLTSCSSKTILVQDINKDIQMNIPSDWNVIAKEDQIKSVNNAFNEEDAKNQLAMIDYGILQVGKFKEPYNGLNPSIVIYKFTQNNVTQQQLANSYLNFLKMETDFTLHDDISEKNILNNSFTHFSLSYLMTLKKEKTRPYVAFYMLKKSSGIYVAVASCKQTEKRTYWNEVQKILETLQIKSE